MTIQPTAVYAPGTSPAQNPPPGSRPGGGQYYVIYNNGATGPNPPNPPNRSIYNRLQRLPQQPATANVPTSLPSFLRNRPMNNRSIVFNTWIIAMILIGFDEWHNLGILPRPARLWDATLVYGVLVMVGFVDVLVPLANALAIGYTFMLLFQYFQGNITPQTAIQQAQATIQPVGYQGVATVPSANPTGQING